MIQNDCIEVHIGVASLEKKMTKIWLRDLDICKKGYRGTNDESR